MKLTFSQRIQPMLWEKGEVNKEGRQELTQSEIQQEGC